MLAGLSVSLEPLSGGAWETFPGLYARPQSIPSSALRGENHHPHPLLCVGTRELAWSARRGRARLQSVCRTHDLENGSPVSINDTCFSSSQPQPCYWTWPSTYFPKKRFNWVFKISASALRKLQNGRDSVTLLVNKPSCASKNWHNWLFALSFSTCYHCSSSLEKMLTSKEINKNAHLSPWRREQGFLTFLESVPLGQSLLPSFISFQNIIKFDG